MKYIIEQPANNINTAIDLPASKSISNRLLIIQALCDCDFNIANLSDSDDTIVLVDALKATNNTIDIGHAGTSMRFMTAYLSTQPNRITTITGSERMKKRPISVLVDALRQLGAEIDYLENEGYPPLKIHGKTLNGNHVEIDGSVSSQYISALLMIAPTLSGGLHIKLKNDIISRAYIKITIELMKYFDIDVRFEDNVIEIEPQKYNARDITVEADWSGVSYWYQIAALSDVAEIEVKGLHKNSLQGDAVLSELFSQFGVSSDFTNDKMTIKKQKSVVLPSFFSFDFTNNPDIAQTMAVTLCMLNVRFNFKGLQTLKIKETDRINALQTELRKLGFLLAETGHGELSWDGKKTTEQKSIVIPTYNDHRMAMAFAPVAMCRNSVTIENPEVVSKSYPGFWNDLQKAGFRIKKQD